MDYSKLGLLIRKHRREQNMTQAVLAEKIGVSTSFIGHIERGSRKLSLETFVQICTALHADPSTLLSFSNESIVLPLTEKEKAQLSALLHYACQLIRTGL